MLLRTMGVFGFGRGVNLTICKFDNLQMMIMLTLGEKLSVFRNVAIVFKNYSEGLTSSCFEQVRLSLMKPYPKLFEKLLPSLKIR